MKSGAAVGWIDASAVRETRKKSHGAKIKCLSQNKVWPSVSFHRWPLPIRLCPSFKNFQATGSPPELTRRRDSGTNNPAMLLPSTPPSPSEELSYSSPAFDVAKLSLASLRSLHVAPTRFAASP